MSSIADALTDTLVQNESITRQRYSELVIKERLYDDLTDLISDKIKDEKGLCYAELKLIYDLHIKIPNEEED